METMMNIMREEAEKLKAQMTEDRRNIHKNPETGMHLPETRDYVISRLKEAGIEAEVVGDSGVSCVIGDPSRGRTVLLRADMDALPQQEENSLPFRSKVSKAHLCGHDMHTSMLLGAARILKEHESELKGAVKLMFQPGEETASGAIEMIKEGILENPHVDAAIAMHISPFFEPGTCNYYLDGAVTSSIDVFFFEFHGKGGHSSMPQKCVDALYIANTFYMQMSSLVSREVDPKETAILTIGKMSGGTAVNIIPDNVEVRCGLRCFNNEVREHLCQRIEELAGTIAVSQGGSADLTLRMSTPSVINDAGVFDAVRPALENVFGSRLNKAENPLQASEDFSHVSTAVPSLYLQIGARHAENECPLHNSQVLLNEDVLPYGAAAYAECAAAYLENADKLK